LGQAPGSTARYAAFGGNPLAVPGNAAMDQFMRNTVQWLTGRSSGLRVVTAHLPGQSTYWFPHEAKVRRWFATQYPGLTLNGQSGLDPAAAAAMADDSCDGSRLDACLQAADLLVIGRQQSPNIGNSTTPDNYPAGVDGSQIMQAVKAAQARGVAVLYLHHYRDANDLAGRLLDHFGLSVDTNYWAQEGLKNAGSADLPATPPGNAELQALLQKLADGGFSTTWSGCVNNLGRVNCDGDAALQREFLAPAGALRTRLRSLDASGVALFSQPGYELEKLLVLLGDKYRAEVSYPMTKESAGLAFFRALYADMAASLNRPSNQVSRDLGNYSGLFAPGTPTLSRLVSSTAPASGTREVMTGLYVLPGRSITLQRSDSSSASLKVGLNMLRDTTRLYNVYDRPTLLSSPRISLAPGQRLTLTSPYGGPLFLFIGAADSTPAVTLQVDGVITHPVLRDASDAAQVSAFAAEVASTPTNWIGLTTDALTVHSTLDHFRTTLAAVGGDMAELVRRINLYMVQDTYELAGFNASDGSLTLPATVSAWCSRTGWDCSGPQHRRDLMQHVISDEHAACGSGCSGNPYDQDWALDPLGWGESHEIGHNLQRARLNIYAGQSGEVSNNIFPIHKQIRANQNRLTAKLLLRGGASTRAAFDALKAAQASADPSAAMRASTWSDTSYAANAAVRLVFYRQLVEYARHYNGSSFSDGWELYTLLYLLDRNVTASAANWAAAAATLGFGSYASYPAGMDGNDFMLIATSRLIGRDLRPVFALWGISWSAAAAAQVDAYALAAAEPLLFPMSDVNQWGNGVGAPILMSAGATYPAGY
ncbi:MAG: hypothetical protein RJA44_918, partial [Pseudomonadota bacterium]